MINRLKKYIERSSSKLPHSYITYLTIFFILEVTIVAFMKVENAHLENDHLKKHNETISDNYYALIDSYRKFSEALYTNVINKKEILEIIDQAYGTDDSLKGIYRKKLYTTLNPAFKIIEHKNYKIFHFHFPNGESFLRFHRPDKYGDNLLEFRYSVEKVNTEKKYVEGFEEGRIENSYRFIRPLSLDGRHIGSVETSIAIREIKEELAKVFKGRTIFLLNDSIINKRGFVEDDTYYVKSDFKNYYIYNKGDDISRDTYSPIDMDLISVLNKKIKKRDLMQMQNKHQFSSLIKHHGHNYIVSFLPISNIRGDHTAYLVFYFEDPNIDTYSKLYSRNIYLGSLINLLIMLLFLFINKDRHSAIKQKSILEKAKIRAEESDKLKSTFLANMSHEIRTPLNSIIGFTDLLINMECSPEERVEYLNIIQRSGGNLLNIINDIIDISRIEAGVLNIVEAPCAVNRIMDDLYELFEDKRKKLNKDIEIVCIKDKPDINFTIETDCYRLQQILTNLIDNALKFTNQGYVKYGYKLETDHILFYTEDSGQGISEKNQEIIFERFKQLGGNIESKAMGVGLGLAISKQLAQLLGGDLYLQSKIDIGTTFFLKLPLK